MKSTVRTLAIAVAALTAATACTSHSGWKIEGSFADAAGAPSKVALEGFNNGRWYLVDSLDVADGRFSYAADMPLAVPDVYRLSHGSSSVYFPVDSAETVTVAINGDTHTLGGSRSAMLMSRADSLLTAAPADSLTKRALTEIVLADSIGSVAYYIVNKTIGSTPLYDPAVRSDLKVIGAVAQKFTTLRPDDPRTALLTATFLSNRTTGAARQPAKEIELPSTGLLDIDLYDNKGTRQRLSEVASKARLTVLSFTRYDMERSAAYNVILNKVHSRYGDAGLKIYQIAFDPDEVNWRTSAANLPWITVWNSPADGADALLRYNVGAFPATFIIDSNGDVVERITDPTTIENAVARRF